MLNFQKIKILNVVPKNNIHFWTEVLPGVEWCQICRFEAISEYNFFKYAADLKVYGYSTYNISPINSMLSIIFLFILQLKYLKLKYHDQNNLQYIFILYLFINTVLKVYIYVLTIDLEYTVFLLLDYIINNIC